MSERRRWIKPAALLAGAAVMLRAERTLERVDRRRLERQEMGEAIDERTEREAEEQLPEPTIWPMILALGVMLGLWGIILQTFFFGLGLLLCLVAVVGWMNLVFGEKVDYLSTTPHEDPRSK